MDLPAVQIFKTTCLDILYEDAPTPTQNMKILIKVMAPDLLTVAEWPDWMLFLFGGEIVGGVIFTLDGRLQPLFSNT